MTPNSDKSEAKKTITLYGVFESWPKHTITCCCVCCGLVSGDPRCCGATTKTTIFSPPGSSAEGFLAVLSQQQMRQMGGIAR